MLSGKKNGCICYTFVKEHLESRENGWHMENERKREVVEHRGKIIHTWNCSKRVWECPWNHFTTMSQAEKEDTNEYRFPNMTTILSIYDLPKWMDKASSVFTRRPSRIHSPAFSSFCHTHISFLSWAHAFTAPKSPFLPLWLNLGLKSS